MTKRNKEMLAWLTNYVAKTAKLPKRDVALMLGTIGDLNWNWSRTKYDLWGLDLTPALNELGERRKPKTKKSK